MTHWYETDEWRDELHGLDSRWPDPTPSARVAVAADRRLLRTKIRELVLTHDVLSFRAAVLALLEADS